MSKKYSDKGLQYEMWSDYSGKSNGSKYDSYGGGKKVWKSCFESHPPLKIGEFTVYGGSCSRPVIEDADVYIGLDSSIQLTSRSWPWEKGNEFLYAITDMCAPKNPESFAKMISWIHEQLVEGKKVHIGCIGGHGRTGTVLAALYKVMTGDEDAITYVRKNYCEKAVESNEQVEFLHKHFGIKKVAGAKAKTAAVYDYKGSSTSSSYSKPSSRGSRVPMIRGAKGNIWGDDAR